ncbi:hypothetical protein V3C99_014821 [Haemonchus contortus]
MCSIALYPCVPSCPWSSIFAQTQSMDRRTMRATRQYVSYCKIVFFMVMVSGYSLHLIEAQTLNCFNNWMTSDDRHIFLDFHNAVRRIVALGRQPNVDEFLPSASNMYKMKWSCVLEDEVNERLNRCDGKQQPLEGFGLNIHELTEFIPKQRPTMEIKRTLAEWWSVLDEHKINEPSSSEIAERFQKVANILHDRTTQIGCSYAFCDKLYIGCMYHLNGTTQDGNSYTEGPFCTHDSDCTTYQPSRCLDGLCIKGLFGM